MTVATTNNRISYTGDGSSTVFAFPYKFITAADLKVYLAGVLQVSGYTVGTPTDTGANVTFTAAPAAGVAIVLLSDPARTQSTSLPTTGPFPAKSVETMVDKLTLLVQRLFDLTTRSLTLADGDSSSASTNLPTPTALQIIGWNAAGNALQNYDAASLAGSVAVVNWQTQRFSGTGAQTAFTLNANPGVASNCDVSISGVTQVADVNFTLNGSTITFTSAPPAGTNNIAIRYGSAGTANTPADGSVSTSKFNATAKAPYAGQADAALSAASGATGTTAAAQDNSTKLATTAYVDRAATLRGYISGLTLSTAGSSATMSIAAGMGMDSTNSYQITLAASISKTTSAWAVGTGNGGLDTGAIANNTWYHWYAIRRPDTGVVDALCSLSASSPTLPTNYTQYRRIGSGKTNGSGQWTKFYQSGDTFWWDAAVFDVGANNPGTAAVTRTLSVPTGVEVEAIFNGGAENTSTGVSGGVYFSSLFVSDQAPSATTAPLWSSGGLFSNGAGGTRNTYTQNRVLTNTSAQIRTRLSASDASVTLYVATLGWVDSRGRNA